MRRSPLAIVALVLIGMPALILLSRQVRSARVLEKRETIVVDESNGQWHHNFVIRVTTPDTTPRDTLDITVGQNQYDANRFGTHVSIGKLAFAPRIAWLRDTSSTRASLLALVRAHQSITRDPTPVSPLDAQTAGLARVTRVHRIQLKPSFRSDALPQWVHLVEVEFWAQRVRALVRTIDVIDAGSIPDLQTGDIVQMHYDQREPRTLRLDDGRRTFTSSRDR